MHAVGMVLGRDHGQRIGLVAMTLEIGLGDLTEDTGETAFNVGLFFQIARLQQRLADLLAWQFGHLLDTHAEHNARFLCRDQVKPLMHRRTPGRAGVFDPGCWFKAEIA